MSNDVPVDDDPSGENPAETSWATPRPAAGALLGGGVVLLGCALLVAADPAGMVLMAVAGLLLLGFGGYAWSIRPRLALTVAPAPVLSVRTLRGTVTLRPDQVERVRVLTLRRIGRRSGQLEIDFAPDTDAIDPASGAEGPDGFGTDGFKQDSRLAVFGRWDLGADPVDVAAALQRAGFPVEH